MALIRCSEGDYFPPFSSDMANMHRDISRMFDTLFRTGWHADSDVSSSAWSPATDVVENNNEYVVKVELPGLSKDDVKVTLQDSVLTVRGEKKHEKEEKKSDYHRVERSFGEFQRSFTLGQSVLGEKVDASFKDGILTVTIPKTEEIKEEQIEIKVR